MGFDLGKLQAIKQQQIDALHNAVATFRSRLDSPKFESICMERAEKALSGGRDTFYIKVNYYIDNATAQWYVCIDYGFFDTPAVSLVGKKKEEQISMMDRFAEALEEKITSMGLTPVERNFRYGIETYDRIRDKVDCRIMGQYHFIIKIDVPQGGN